MQRGIPKIIAIFFYLFFILPVAGQDISFFHLSKKEGLSDNQIAGVVMDKNGLLWVGTSEGLNCYDGYTVKRFYKEEYPALQNNNILRMTCDEKNRLWIHFADKSIAMLDEDRKFHAISIMDKGKQVKADFLLPYTSRGVLFLSGSRLYYPNEKDPLIINRLKWDEDTSLNNDFVRINIWDKDKLICSGNNRLALFDVTRLKVLHTMVVPGIRAAARLSDNEALITIQTKDKLCKVNLATKKIIQYYARLHDQYGEEMMANPQSIYPFRDQQFIFTSPYAGLYIFDAAKETLIRYKHDPVDPCFRIAAGIFLLLLIPRVLITLTVTITWQNGNPFFGKNKQKKYLTAM
jgi:Two component regulator propeller